MWPHRAWTMPIFGSVDEMRQGTPQEIGGRDEVGVEDGDELASSFLQSRLERACLVAPPVDPVEVVDLGAAGPVTTDRHLGNSGRFVCRVVQNLDLEKLRWVIHFADRVDQPVGDIHLVENRQLDGDARQILFRERRRNRHLPLVLHVKIHKVIAVPSVDRQDAQHEEVDNEDERLRQRHKRMNPSLSINGHYTVRLAVKSTNRVTSPAGVR